MAKVFLTSINLSGQELQNAVIQNLASLPAGTKGQIAYDTAKDMLAVKPTGVWKYLEYEIVAGTTGQYWRGDKTWQTLDKAAVGLANVDNTADANKAVLSATKLATSRNFSITGGATASAIGFDGTGAVALNVTALDASKLGGTIPSAVLGNSTLYVGTTAIPLNRASGLQAVTGLSSIQLVKNAGSAKLMYDDVNNAVYVVGSDGVTPVNFYSTGELSAYGAGLGTGAVTAMSELTDVSFGALATNDVLRYNGTHWVNIPQSALVPDLSAYATQSYVNSAITSLLGAAPAALDTLQELAAALDNNASFASSVTTALSGKEPTIATGTTSQYWRGDKTWQTLNTTAVAEGTNQYFTTARVLATALTGYVVGANTAIAASDTILAAFQKIQGQINARISGNQSITISGDATGSGTTSIALTLANSGVTAGTYRSVTVDAKGRVTAGTNPTTLSGYGIVAGDALFASVNAGTATKLATARSISIGGTTGLTASAISFDGSGNVALALTGTLATTNGGTGFTDAKNGVARKVLGTFSTSATSYAITHNLGTDVVAQVMNVSTGEVVMCDIVMTNANTTTFLFNVAPTANAYKYIIVG